MKVFLSFSLLVPRYVSKHFRSSYLFGALVTCVLFGLLPGLSLGQGDPAAPAAAPAAPATATSASVVTAEVPASCASIQALIYPDIATIMRVETQRIDFVGLEKIAQDFVQYAIGSFDIEDKYLVKLRDNQKSILKQRIVDYLELLRSNYSRVFWANGVNEYYRIRYVDGQDFCNCIAVPIGSMSETGIAAVEQYLVREYNPIVTFKRFGFIIAIDDHSSKVVAAGTAQEEEEEEEEEDVTAGGGGSANAARAKAMKEREKFLKERLKATTPAIRKRFFLAAKKDPGITAVASALASTHGAAITFVMKDANAVLEMANWLVLNGIELPLENLQTTVDANKAKLKWATFNVSLVGAPRVVILAQLADGATATIFSTLITGMLDGLKTSINTKLDEQVKSLDLLKDKFEKNPFAPMLDVFFASLHPRIKGSQVALVLDTQNILDNAPTFVPLFGGVSKEMPEKKPGEADVDMFGDTEAAPDGQKPAAKPAAPGAPAAPVAPKKDSKKEDDPFA